MRPPKQTQYHVRHWPGDSAAADATAPAWASMYFTTDGGTFCSAASSVDTPGADTAVMTDEGTSASAFS